MSLGNLFSSFAPMAVGAMFPVGLPALAAGAVTGAAIAKARGQDPLAGAFTGGISGYGGGNLGAGLKQFGTEQALGSTSSVGPVTFEGARGTGSVIAPPEVLPTGTKALGQGITAALNKPTDFLRSMGGGDALKGGLKTAGALAPGVAGAMVPDMNATTAEMNQYKYDPNRRLNLNRSTGLRLMQEGGYIPYEFSDSYTMDPERFRMFMMQREMRGPKEEVVYDEGLQALENERARRMRDRQAVENERARVMREIDPYVGTEKESRDRFNSLMEAFEAERQMIKNMPEGPEKDEIMRMNDNFAPQEFYYNQGGYLETGGKVGDGMSDEIMGTIDNTQPVRLSDGEFVIPADVVSHLGNGSSDAGAEQLYSMMDRIRKARTGNERQGKEITPERFMPV